jgi:hypothetical protein
MHSIRSLVLLLSMEATRTTLGQGSTRRMGPQCKSIYPASIRHLALAQTIACYSFPNPCILYARSLIMSPFPFHPPPPLIFVCSSLAEYDCTSVTSTGKENFVPFLPPDLVAEALVRGIQNRTEGGGFTGSLAYSETESRGFTLVTLNKLEHKGQFLFVDSVASKEYSVSKCHQVDYDLAGRGRMAMKGSCTFEDPGRPYESQGKLHVSLCGCRPGQCRHGCTPIAESPVDGGSGAWIDKADGGGGLTDWLENAGSTVIDDLTNAATSSGAGAGTAAAVLAALVMITGLIVLYRRYAIPKP